MSTTKQPLELINQISPIRKIKLDDAPVTPGAKLFLLSLNSINDNPDKTSYSYIERSNAELMEHFKCSRVTIAQWLDELTFINALWIAYKPIRMNGILQGKARKIFTDRAFYEMFLKENPDYQRRERKNKNPRKIARLKKTTAKKI